MFIWHEVPKQRKFGPLQFYLVNNRFVNLQVHKTIEFMTWQVGLQTLHLAIDFSFTTHCE